jgi:hypothetical protein
MSYPVAPLPDTNSRQPAITMRQSSTSLLTIDSEDRFANYDEAGAAASENPQKLNVTPYDFVIRKPESLMNGFFTRIGITEVNFPWGIPNINAKTNKITIAWAGLTTGQVTVTILDGFYSPVALANHIQGIVRAFAGGGLANFTMTYGATGTPAFEYDTKNSAQLISFQPLAYNSATYPFPSTTKQLFQLMGFSSLNSAFESQGISGYTFCQYTKYIDLTCYQLTNNQSLKDQTSQRIARDMLCRLYLGDANTPGNVPLNTAADPSGNPAYIPAGCAPFTIYRNFNTPKQIQWIPNQPIPGYLAFQVYDDAGAPLNEILPNATPEISYDGQATFLDWSMTMLVSEN